MRRLFVVSTVLSIFIAASAAYAIPTEGSLGDQEPAPASSLAASPAQNCVQAGNLPPTYRSLFNAVISSFFANAPCILGRPRVVVRGFTYKPTGGVSLDFTIDGDQKTVSGTNIYEIIGRVAEHVNNLPERTAETSALNQASDLLCARGKRVLKEAPDDAVGLILRYCPKPEGDAFAERHWQEFEKGGRFDLAVLLAERINLTFEADRIRGEMSRIGFLRVITKPAGARLWIDGVDTGLTTPIMLHRISVGRHTIEFKIIREKCGTYSIEVHAGEILPFFKQLECVKTK